jgi:branched-chain amino acid transport system permease protein
MNYVGDVVQLFLLLLLMMLGMNFLVGGAGVSFIGHTAFYAGGAYCSAVLTSAFGFSALMALGTGVLLNVIFAWAFGLLAVRLEGHHLILASLGICEIWRSVANAWNLTGAAEGLGVSAALLPGLALPPRQQALLITGAFSLIFTILFAWIQRSRGGSIFNAMRDDEMLVRETGRSTDRLKMQAMVLSSIPASIAGSLFAHYMGYIDPTSFMPSESLMMLMGLMIGGVATVKGSFAGAAIMVIVPALSRFVQLPPTVIAPSQRIIFAVLVLIVLRLKPQGLFGRYQLP